MEKKTGASTLLDAIKQKPGSTIADLVEATGMNSNCISSTISIINKAPEKYGATISGKKIEGSCAFRYTAEFSSCRKEGKSDQPEKTAAASVVSNLAPSRDNSSSLIAQYIIGQMRSEVDAMLASIVAPAVEAGIESMLSGIRSAIADAFRHPVVHAEINKRAIEPENIKLPMPIALVDEPRTERPASNQEHATAVTPSSPSPIRNILSTRTKHRERTRHDAAAEVVEHPAAEPGKRKVIICSLLPAQQEIINKEFCDCFSLRMFYKDQEKAMRKAINPGDTVLLMGDWLGHSVFEAAKAAGAEVITVKGGMTHLREALTRLYCENKAAA